MTEITRISKLDELRRSNFDAAASRLNWALKDLEAYMEGNDWRPLAILRPELKRRLENVLGRCKEVE